MKTINLRRCPFCGSEGIYETSSFSNHHRIYCDKCLVSPNTHWQKSKKRAFEIWNQRYCDDGEAKNLVKSYAKKLAKDKPALTKLAEQFISNSKGPKSCKNCILGSKLGFAKVPCNSSYESHIKFFPKDKVESLL